jgi:two-component system sensor histidine kinase AlgZ
MIFNINRKKWIVIVVIAIITVLIPILITAFELITTEKESVVFLEGYPTSISIILSTITCFRSFLFYKTGYIFF